MFGFSLPCLNLFSPVQLCVALFGSVWLYLVLFGPVFPIFLFGPIWPCLALFGHVGPSRIFHLMVEALSSISWMWLAFWRSS